MVNYPVTKQMKVNYSDGGRPATRRKKHKDCVTRAIAVATGKPYGDVYQELMELAATERPRGRRKRSHPGQGVHMRTVHRYMATQPGWTWIATMGIGTGCRVHLRAEELPPGRLIVRVSKHLVAVIDGVVHDTFDPTRYGTRCVYGYWKHA